MRLAAILSLTALLAVPATAQTLNRQNFGCLTSAAQRCFFEQDGRPDGTRGGQSRTDYCTHKAMVTCGEADPSLQDYDNGN
jgi:hypothetical protein